MIKIFITGLFLTFSYNGLFAQQIKILTEKDKISLRGLSVVSNNICWVSGSKGIVVRTTDGGKNFEWLTVKGYEQRDFRDIEAFDANTAVIMAVAEPAIILKTKDGGKNWYKVFEDSTKGMFLDAMDFDGKNGVVIGDPINNHAFYAVTANEGENWISSSRQLRNTTATGEAFFAASGTNIKYFYIPQDCPSLFYVSGGIQSSCWFLFDKKRLPIIQGKETTGANSIDIFNNKGIIVGGDFANDKDTTQNCVLIDFKPPIKFSHPQTPPHGYRSCVIYVNEKTLLTCGTSGVDISRDGGMNWQLISNESFHVVQKAKQGNAIFMAGANGRIALVEVQ